MVVRRRQKMAAAVSTKMIEVVIVCFDYACFFLAIFFKK